MGSTYILTSLGSIAYSPLHTLRPGEQTGKPRVPRHKILAALFPELFPALRTCGGRLRRFVLYWLGGGDWLLPKDKRYRWRTALLLLCCTAAGPVGAFRSTVTALIGLAA